MHKLIKYRCKKINYAHNKLCFYLASKSKNIFEKKKKQVNIFIKKNLIFLSSPPPLYKNKNFFFFVFL